MQLCHPKFRRDVLFYDSLSLSLSLSAFVIQSNALVFLFPFTLEGMKLDLSLCEHSFKFAFS
jgi:hypothetical protein